MSAPQDVIADAVAVLVPVLNHIPAAVLPGVQWNESDEANRLRLARWMVDRLDAAGLLECRSPQAQGHPTGNCLCYVAGFEDAKGNK